jgi:Glycosyl transferase family 11
VIAVALGGGVGNQLFQYATARALALRLAVPLMVDDRQYRRRSWPVYALEAFAIAAAPPDEKLLPRYDHGFWPGLAVRFLGRGGRFRIFSEAGFAFDETVLSLHDWTYLRGNFQSPLYFVDQETTLRRDLAFVAPMDAANHAVADEIAGTMAVSLHIRRGDYVTNPRANRVHGTVDLDFYARAAELIASRCDSTPTFFVFSDDPAWVAENLKLRFAVRPVVHNHPERGTEDLRLMALCAHHIVANSSFSWWGAWLNPASDKIVVAPRGWFRDPTKDVGALMPPEWIRL